jgi:hypothetical protein
MVDNPLASLVKPPEMSISNTAICFKNSACKSVVIAAVSLIVSTLTASASTIINGFGLTTSTYAQDSNWDSAVKSEFGQTATVASFEQIKAAFQNDIPSLVTLLAGNWAGVTYNGNRFFSDTRAYFITYHGSIVPGGWLVHDKIGSTTTGNQVSLGSWYGQMPILATNITAVPEPTGALLSVLGAAMLMCRRKR